MRRRAAPIEDLGGTQMPVTWPDAIERGQNGNPTRSASGAVPVAKSDSTEVSSNGVFPTGLYVGTGGNLTVDMANGVDVDRVYKNVADGTTLDIRVSKVKAATTAADILALYP